MSVTDGPEALAGVVDVSRETTERLTVFVDLMRKWQPAENLVAPSTLPAIWRRHVADSAQLVRYFPSPRHWLDLGTGAGFPGLVIAIITGATVDLIESNRRKCAFLRRAIHATGASAAVHEGRIENVLNAWKNPTDMVTARALAPLSKLFEYAEKIVASGARALFLKGKEAEREIIEASEYWDFDLVRHRSRVDDSGVILEIARVAPRAAH